MFSIFRKLNLARYFRKRQSDKYPLRFIQDIDYEELFGSGKGKFRYQLLIDKVIITTIISYTIKHRLFELLPCGLLTIKRCYRWDGPSGPTVDTPSFMRSSCAHDVIFQCLREWLFGLITEEEFQSIFGKANKDLQRISEEDGMMWPRHGIVKLSVQKFGEKHARPKKPFYTL